MMREEFEKSIESFIPEVKTGMPYSEVLELITDRLEADQKRISDLQDIVLHLKDRLKEHDEMKFRLGMWKNAYERTCEILKEELS